MHNLRAILCFLASIFAHWMFSRSVQSWICRVVVADKLFWPHIKAVPHPIRAMRQAHIDEKGESLRVHDD
jgi:hypothetical protein